MVMARRTGKWGEIHTWMKNQVLAGQYVDCGEVQLTLLGEATAFHFNLVEADLDEVDELAFEVSEWYENTLA